MFLDGVTDLTAGPNPPAVGETGVAEIGFGVSATCAALGLCVSDVAALGDICAEICADETVCAELTWVGLVCAPTTIELVTGEPAKADGVAWALLVWGTVSAG